MISTTANNKKKIWKPLVSVIFWIGAWFLLACLINKELIFPSPVEVLKHLAMLVKEESFWLKTAVSLLRVLSGFIAGVVCGLILAGLSVISDICDAIISPFIRLVKSTPVTSFVMLVMLWISYDLVPVFIAALLVTPIIYANVREGILETPRSLAEVTELYRFSRMKTLNILYIPSVRPYFVSGAMTSLGLAWKAGIAAEVLSLPSKAIGREIYYSKLYLETADLFAWTVVVIAFSYLFEKLLERAVKNRRKAAVKQDAAEEMQYSAESAIPDMAKEWTKEPEQADERTKEPKLAGAESGINGAEEQTAGAGKDCTGKALVQEEVKNEQTAEAEEIEIEMGGSPKRQLIINNLSVAFDDKKVLDGLSVSFNSGITCLMAESGAGKTTLLRVIAGLLKADGGTVDMLPEKLSFMFQEDRLFPWLSAVDNVSVVCDDKNKAERLLAALELWEHKDKLPSELSGGMCRRVALARALAYGGELLILDEPFKGLDEALKERVCAIVKADAAKTIIVATHDRRDSQLLGAKIVQI